MNKKEIIDRVAETTGESKTKVGEIVEATFATIQDAVKQGDKVAILGFGAFEKVTSAARIGRNPKTGEEIQIAPSVRPKFTAGKAFKDHIR